MIKYNLDKLSVKKIIILSVVVLLFAFTIPFPNASSDVAFNSAINVSNDATNSGEQQISSAGNNVYVVWRNSTMSSANSAVESSNTEIFFKTSTNSGTSFGSPINLSNTLGLSSVSSTDKVDGSNSHVTGSSQLAQINATGNKVYVVWVETINPGTVKDAIYFTNGTSGANFGTPINLRSATTHIVDTPQVASTSGKVYVTWTDKSVTDGDIFFTNSLDDGKTFSTATDISNDLGTSQSAQIAASSSNVYAVWENDTRSTDTPANDPTNILYARSTNNGGSFESVVKLGTISTLSATPKIVAAGSNVYIVAVNNTSISFKKSTDSGATFGSTINLGNVGTSTSPNPQISASGNNVYVTWVNKTGSSNPEIAFTKSTDNGASFSIPINLSGNSGSSQSPQIASSSNNVFVTWQDDTVGNNEALFKASPDSGSTFCSTNNLSSNSQDSTGPVLSTSGSTAYTLWRDASTSSSKDGDIKFRGGTATSTCVVQFNATQYKMSNTASLTVNNPSSDTSGSADVISVTVTSSTDSTGISLSLTETGAHTGIFTGTMHFTSGSSSSGSLKTSPGDTITATFGGLTGTASIYSRAVAFDFTTYSLGDKAHITVTDNNAITNSAIVETISIKITSNADSSGVTLVLTETGAGTGIFKKDTLAFTTGPTTIDVSNTATITEDESDNSQITAGTPRTLTTLSVSSDSDTVGFNPLLTETSTTNTFNGKLKFTTGSTSGGALKAKGGDIVTLNYRGAPTNILVVPNTNSSVNAIKVSATSSACSSCITATWQSTSTSISITPGSGGGGGGGGLVRPGLVLDAIAGGAIGGNSPVSPTFDLASLAATVGSLPDYIRQEVLDHDPNKPILPSYDSSFDYPLYIDGGGYVLGGYQNTIQTITEKTQVPVNIELNLPATNLEHMALYTNLRGLATELENSDTYIVYQKGEPLHIVDPHGYFENVKFDLTTEGIKNKIDYKITFAKPMEKSNIIFRAWNDRKASGDVKIQGALQVVESQKLTSDSESSAPQQVDTPLPDSQIPEQSSVTTLLQSSKTTENILPSIKDWGGYSSHPITDSQFLSNMGMKGTSIPSWAAKTTKMVVEGDLTSQEFETMMQYLVSAGVVK